VLNDEWVSHPTWASEEAGFMPHKKNSFEEALHKSEEERFEYQVHLEALARTISVLEPLNTRIEEMTTEERTTFKLKANFGGPSKALYHRILKKIYNRDGGAEVIQALQDCPSVAVPVVLGRLKQKDLEWRQAQREWSRTWREVDSKNFYKSLDHQGIAFKQNEKKLITAKHFVGDIETMKTKQVEQWEEQRFATGAVTTTKKKDSVKHQLHYELEDTSTLMDTLRMICCFLENASVQYSPPERRGIEKFLRVFIPLLCMYPVAEFNAAFGHHLESGSGTGAGGSGGDDDSVDYSVYPATGSGRRSAGSNGSSGSSGVAPGDLRRKLLRMAQERAAGGTGQEKSREASPTSGNRSPLSKPGEVPHDIWIDEAGTEPVAQDQGGTVASGAEGPRPFFANTTFYTLLRLLQVCDFSCYF
jgi:paired amphipathic helix protein Sin3a